MHLSEEPMLHWPAEELELTEQVSAVMLCVGSAPIPNSLLSL